MSDIQKLPDDELNKVNYDDMFKRSAGIEEVCGMPEQDGYIYKAVITSYPASAGPTLVRNYDNHRKMGFEVVVTTKSIKDDRVFSPNSNQKPNTVPSPLIGKTSDGYDYVVMRIKKDVHDAYMKVKDKKDYDAYVKSTGAKITRQGENLVIQDGLDIIKPNINK